MRFILGGRVFDLERDDVLKAVKGKEAGPIRKYAVKLHGRAYPIKQVYGLATGLPNAEFTAHDAYRVLKKLGFEIAICE